MPTNSNSLNGYGMNPYDPRRDPRDATADGRPALAPGGSSSGTGTAASFWAANVGAQQNPDVADEMDVDRDRPVTKPTAARTNVSARPTASTRQ
jgi:hypothetical protein